MATTTSPVCSKSPAYLLIILHQTTQYMYLPLGNPYNQSKAHICVPLARLSLLHSALRPYQVYSTSLPLYVSRDSRLTSIEIRKLSNHPPDRHPYPFSPPYQHATTTTLMIVHNLEDILGNVNDPASLPARFYLSVRLSSPKRTHDDDDCDVWQPPHYKATKELLLLLAIVVVCKLNIANEADG